MYSVRLLLFAIRASFCCNCEEAAKKWENNKKYFVLTPKLCSFTGEAPLTCSGIFSVNDVNHHGGGVAAAGGAAVVAWVWVCRLGHYQRTLGTLRSLLILQTDSTSSTVKVKNSGIFIPLDVGGRGGEQPDGAGQTDGAARLDKHGGLPVYDGCGRENVEPEAEVYLGLSVHLTLIVTFVSHSCQINTEDPVISARRVSNQDAAANMSIVHFVRNWLPPPSLPCVTGERHSSAGQNHGVNSSPDPRHGPVCSAPDGAHQPRCLALHTWEVPVVVRDWQVKVRNGVEEILLLSGPVQILAATLFYFN